MNDIEGMCVDVEDHVVELGRGQLRRKTTPFRGERHGPPHANHNASVRCQGRWGTAVWVAETDE